MIYEDGIYTGIFNKTCILGFEYGKQYTFQLKKKPRGTGYDINELEDDLYMIAMSTISLNQYFLNIKRID